MQILTIVFGLALAGVGVAGYVETGSAHPTALIPCWIGLVLALCGGLAMAPARRMLWMHIAVTVGLLGFLGTVKGAVDTFRLAHGASFEHPIAVEEKGATCLLCLIFVAFCVRSFIAARRARVLGMGLGA
jgi:hypothetical protein